MKVEIITLHYVTNFGSLLQTYATQRIIRNMNCESEMIDFVPVGLSFKMAVWPKNRSTISKVIKFIPLLICNIFQFNMVKTFLKKYISLSKIRYKSYYSLKKNYPKADVYVSGSDQIWNTQNNNLPDDLGAYYLAFVKNKKKISYASSFGKEKFNDIEKMMVSNWLNEYSAISVREDTALNTLNEFGLSGQQVLDPTLLLTTSDWEDLIIEKGPSYNYIFVYNLNRNKTIEKIAIAISRIKNLRIINIADTFEMIQGAKNKLFNTPHTFLNYLKNAEYVITDSFHGTAFSINFSKQFICVPAPQYNCRIESLLRLFKLESRMVCSVDSALSEINKTIDYFTVNKKLYELRSDSLNYLQRVLNNE